MRTLFAISAIAFLLGLAPAGAQQIVETSTGKHAGGGCATTEALAAAIADAEATRTADAKSRLDTLLGSALARTEPHPRSQSPVTFPPARNGS